jgi:type IV secretory pathway VirD2 relaxase
MKVQSNSNGIILMFEVTMPRAARRELGEKGRRSKRERKSL